MAFNYTVARDALRQIAERVTFARSRLSQIQADARQVEVGLLEMQTQYAPLKSFVDAEAAASPGDGSVQTLQSELDRMIADFVALRNNAKNMNDGMDAYDFSTF